MRARSFDRDTLWTDRASKRCECAYIHSGHMASFFSVHREQRATRGLISATAFLGTPTISWSLAPKKTRLIWLLETMAGP
jgi:hypothetical protein